MARKAKKWERFFPNQLSEEFPNRSGWTILMRGAKKDFTMKLPNIFLKSMA